MGMYKRLTSYSRVLALVSTVLFLSGPVHAQQPQGQEEVRGVPAEPADAAEARAQIAILEKLQPTFPDRGAVLYYLAALHQHLGETLEATKLLKGCIALGEGFDPAGEREFAGLHTSHEFTELVEKVHREFPAVAQRGWVSSPKKKISFRKGLPGIPIARSFT